MRMSAKLREKLQNIYYYGVLQPWQRLTAGHMWGGNPNVGADDDEPTGWQKLLIVASQILNAVYVLGCYFVGAGSIFLFCIAFGMPHTLALIIGFVVVLAFSSAFVNLRISLVDVPQGVLHLLGWVIDDDGNLHGTLFNIVDDNENPVLEVDPNGSGTHIKQMTPMRKFVLFLTFLVSLAAGMVVGGVTYGFCLTLGPSLLAVLPFLTGVYPFFALAIVGASAVAITFLVFNAWHDYVNKEWFTPEGIFDKIKHYFVDGLYQEIVENLEVQCPELVGTEELHQRAKVQFVTTVVLSVLLIGLIISGLVMTIFFASRPGIADFFDYVEGAANPSKGLILGSWLIAAQAFMGEFSFYMAGAIMTAASFCTFVNSESSEEPEEIYYCENKFFNAIANKLNQFKKFLLNENNFYTENVFANAVVNAFIGLKAFFGMIVLGTPLTIGYIAFSLFSFVGAFLQSVSAGMRGSETNRRFVLAQAPKLNHSVYCDPVDHQDPPQCPVNSAHKAVPLKSKNFTQLQQAQKQPPKLATRGNLPEVTVARDIVARAG